MITVTLILLAFFIIAGTWSILVQLEIFTGEFIGLPKPIKIKCNEETLIQTDRIHKSLLVADLHADSLMWRRNLSKRHQRGYFDFPRMAEGNVTLQCLLSVTEMPKKFHGGNLTDKSNQLTTLGIIDQWPLAALTNQTHQALYYARKLAKYCEQSNGSVIWIKSSGDLHDLLNTNNDNKKKRGVILGLEGADGTGYSVEKIEQLFSAGYRTSELCHLTDTEYASSSTGVRKGGLTQKGIEAVCKMNQLGMLIDLAHASTKTVTDVLKYSDGVPYISHTGSASISSDPKCFPDEILKEVVRRGGIVGICFVEDYINGKTIHDIAKSIEHLVVTLGTEGVALGSGFDSVRVPLAVDQMAYITQSLIDLNFDTPTIASVMGGNVVKYFIKALHH